MTLGVITICYFTECGMSHDDVPNQLFFFRALFLYVFFFEEWLFRRFYIAIPAVFGRIVAAWL